jgi:hypothetical protein
MESEDSLPSPQVPSIIPYPKINPGHTTTTILCRSKSTHVRFAILSALIFPTSNQYSMYIPLLPNSRYVPCQSHTVGVIIFIEKYKL